MTTLARSLAAAAAAAAFALLAAPDAAHAQNPAPAASAQDPHAGHSHGHAHSAETLKADLGTTTIAGVEVTVVQGNLAEPGTEVAFDITVKAATKFRAIRGWIGAADGKGALKSKADKEKDGGWHLHVEAPKTLSTADMLHIEVEPHEGPRAKAGFEIKRK